MSRFGYTLVDCRHSFKINHTWIGASISTNNDFSDLVFTTPALCILSWMKGLFVFLIKGNNA